MKITELESKGLKRKYRIVVEAAQINAQAEAELKTAGERVKIPGFRPGNIPMKVLKQRYGKNVQADVLKQAINTSTTEALKKHKIRPAITPEINIENYKEEGDLTYTMECETFPEVPEPNFGKITLERPTFEIAEKDIDEAAERIAERNPRLERDKEGRAKKGQVVTIDFKGTLSGKAFAGGSAENFKLELGSGQFIPGFEEQLVGAKEGEERTVTVTFPKDYQAEDLAGKETEFAVKVREIHDKVRPAIDEAFAKAAGFADLRAFREALRDQMMKEYGGAVRDRLKKQLFDTLDETCGFDLPQGMVDAEFKSIWERLQQARARQEVTADKNDEELEKEYRDIARRRVKLGILLAEVGARQKIQITREEMNRAVMHQASLFPGQEKQVIEFYQKNPGRADDLRGPILEEKVVDFILTQVKYEDRKMSLAQLREEEGEGEAPQKKSGKAKAKK